MQLNPLALHKRSTWQKYEEDSECTEERHMCSGSSRNCRDTAARASISADLPSPPAADQAQVTFLVSDVVAKEHERWVLLCRRPPSWCSGAGHSPVQTHPPFPSVRNKRRPLWLPWAGDSDSDQKLENNHKPDSTLVPYGR